MGGEEDKDPGGQSAVDWASGCGKHPAWWRDDVGRAEGWELRPSGNLQSRESSEREVCEDTFDSAM